jgi:hypothetical protein
MTETTKTRLGLLIVASGLAVWAYQSWVAAPERHRYQVAQRNAADVQRFKDWAYIAKEKEIAPGETVRLVVIPSAMGEPMDTKCFLYTHREFRTSSMICPDADRNFIDQADPQN